MSMVKHMVEPSGSVRRLEVITGVGGRRRWSEAEKARITAEAMMPGAVVSEGIRENWWRQGMMGGITAQYQCVKVLSETEFYDDLALIDIPVLVMHGEDDQICPFPTTGARSVKLLKQGTLKSYPGLPHGMPTTHADQINADLLTFIQS